VSVTPPWAARARLGGEALQVRASFIRDRTADHADLHRRSDVLVLVVDQIAPGSFQQTG